VCQEQGGIDDESEQQQADQNSCRVQVLVYMPCYVSKYPAHQLKRVATSKRSPTLQVTPNLLIVSYQRVSSYLPNYLSIVR
jgi:hypothetical protein